MRMVTCTMSDNSLPQTFSAAAKESAIYAWEAAYSSFIPYNDILSSSASIHCRLLACAFAAAVVWRASSRCSFFPSVGTSYCDGYLNFLLLCSREDNCDVADRTSRRTLQPQYPWLLLTLLSCQAKHRPDLWYGLSATNMPGLAANTLPLSPWKSLGLPFHLSAVFHPFARKGKRRLLLLPGGSSRRWASPSRFSR